MKLIKTVFLTYFLFISQGFANYYKNMQTAEVSLISEVKSFQAGSDFYLAINFKIKDYFDIGWINPGDTGISTQIELILPKGFRQENILYPYPSKIDMSFLSNYGYEKEAVFLIKIKPNKDFKESSATISANLEWLACSGTCIPEKTTLSLNIPLSAKTIYNNELKEDFRKWLSKIPENKEIKANFNKKELDYELNFNFFDLFSLKDISDIKFFPFEAGVISHSSPQAFSIKDGVIFLKLKKGDALLAKPSEMSGVLVIKSKDGQIKSYQITAKNNHHSLTLLNLILIGLLGGLLLNLMPCVLPVLSLKFLSMQHLSEIKNNHKAKLHGILYALGVILSFIALSLIILALRSMGKNLGWGFQLQEPLFVLFLIYLTFIIAVNLSGLFLIGSKISTYSGDFICSKKGLSSSFFTGILAVFLAAPCTVPFMGTALGAALTIPYKESFFIFLSLGIGLSLPYLIFSFSPYLIKFMPKPGEWMITLKQILSIPLYLTSLWLLWLLYHQSGFIGALIALSGIFLILTYFIFKNEKVKQQIFHKIVCTIILISILFTFPCLYKYKSQKTNEHLGTPYSKAKLEELISINQPVLLHFTADWCLLCLLNSFSFHNDDIQNFFHKHNITYMVADWTNEDKEISEALKNYNKAGVPLYVFYPNNGESYVIMPEIITSNIIKEVIVTKLKLK